MAKLTEKDVIVDYSLKSSRHFSLSFIVYPSVIYDNKRNCSLNSAVWELIIIFYNTTSSYGFSDLTD